MDRTMTKVLVGGAGGFIGGHLVRRLKREGFWVRGLPSSITGFRNAQHQPIKVGMRDLDPEFAAQWGIEPEDAFTMLVSPARQSEPLSLSNLARGVGQAQDTTGPTVREKESAAIPPRLR